MEALLIFLLVIILIVVIKQKSALTDSIGDLRSDVIKLQSQITKLVQRLEQPAPTTEKAGKPIEPPVAEKVEEEQKRPEPVPEKIPEAVPPPVIQSEKAIQPPVKRHVEPPAVLRKPAVPKEPELSFFERHPDIEKFIGENLVNKIGIAILVLSIGYFVKYAIDSNWIGPVGRVGIGMLAGAILIGVAHRLRSSYHAFSSVLVGGGLAVFYFTISLAFHHFHLFSQMVSLLIMVVITAFAVMLSLLYDKQELAVIALVGGFGSPFMLSTGHANYHGLFIYLLILNLGLLIIAFYKSWRILNIVSFALTVLVAGGVLYMLNASTYHIGFIYISIFYFMYLAINLAYNVRENKNFIASDFSILLINTALYFSAGLYLLTVMNLTQFRGIFSASLAVVNLSLSYVLFKNKKVDANILYLLIGITLTFISLTAPIQLKGNHITLFWASEAVVLYWLYLKSRIELTRLSSQIIWVAMLISLSMDWLQIYSSSQIQSVLINKAFITGLYSAIASFIMMKLASKVLPNAEVKPLEFEIPLSVIKGIALTLLFLTGLLEVNFQFLSRYPQSDVNLLYLMLYVPAFVLAFTQVASRLSGFNLSLQQRAAAFAITVAVYLICEPQFNYLQWDILERGTLSGNHFIAHWISALIVGVIFYQLVQFCITLFDGSNRSNIIWALCGAVVLFLSLEVNLLSNIIFYSKQHSIEDVQRVFIKTGLPVLWGILSFAIMWLGMKYKNRPLRVVSLSLFSLTLLKLFLFDIRNIPAAGKIVAFFCLGVILLVISFMYQKLKKIIITDEAKVEE